MLIVLVLMMVRLPSHLSTTSRSSSSGFNEWISDSMNSKLRFAETENVIAAEEDVKLGEVLFDFEASKVITIRNLMRSKDKDLYAQIYEKYEVGNLWMNEIALAAYLCVEYRNPVGSDILSYLESLPQRNTDSMSFGLMFYPERALERVLHGSSTLNTLRRVRGYVREIFESVLSPSSLFSKTPLTLGEFEYVFCVSHSHTRKSHVQHPQVRSWNCIGKGIRN